MLNLDDIRLAMKDAGLTIAGGQAIEDKVVKQLQELSIYSGVKNGQELMLFMDAHHEASPPYLFYIAPHESDPNKKVTFSFDYPEVTVVIPDSTAELQKVAQGIVYEAHEKLMEHEAIIRPPMMEINQKIPSGSGFVRIHMGDLYALRLFQYNLRVVCKHYHLEPSLDLDPDQEIPLH